jgi:hypothetical protein
MQTLVFVLMLYILKYFEDCEMRFRTIVVSPITSRVIHVEYQFVITIDLH